MCKNDLLKALASFSAAVLIASFANTRASAGLDCEFVSFMYGNTIKACNAGNADACGLLAAHKKNYDQCVVDSEEGKFSESPPPSSLPPPAGGEADTAEKKDEKEEKRCSEELTAKDNAIIQEIVKGNRRAKWMQRILALAPFSGVASGDPLEAAITALTTDPSLHAESMTAVGTVKACSISTMIDAHLEIISDKNGCRHLFFRKIQEPYNKRCSR